MRKTILFLIALATGLALVFLLAGCVTLQLLKGSGELTPPPSGYIVECVNNPALENCKP